MASAGRFVGPSYPAVLAVPGVENLAKLLKNHILAATKPDSGIREPKRCRTALQIEGFWGRPLPGAMKKRTE
jgi:hypothetical protein